MKKNDLHDALSGINKDFIAESDDFKAVSADFRKVKSRKNRIVISTLCLAFVGIGVIGTAKKLIDKSISNNKSLRLQGLNYYSKSLSASSRLSR